jgi:hypothetical protein
MMYVLIELRNTKSRMPKGDDRVCNSKHYGGASKESALRMGGGSISKVWKLS